MRHSWVAGTLTTLFSVSSAQFPVTPTGLNTVNSKVNSAAKISYKQFDICETTAGIKSYSGFVHLPASILTDVSGDFPINTYFQYFEARHNASTAPLALYFAGGAGESSAFAAFNSETGPCYVNEAANDTILNPWSFNNNVNMLYIDQPVQSGFSYDRLVNGTDNLQDQIIIPHEYSGAVPAKINATTFVGTWPSQNPQSTTNTTVSSGRAIWHFLETWLSSFPEHKTSSNKIAVWGNSYGGLWAPEVAVRLSKNLKRLPPKHPLKADNLVLDTLGITDGFIDLLYITEGYAQYAWNNTYGIRYITEDMYHQAVENITAPGGLIDMTKQCRALVAAGEPLANGNNQTVNEACMAAWGAAGQAIFAFDKLNLRNPFDIAVKTPDPCPYYLPTERYFNRPEVQQALGVPLNFSYDSNLVGATYGLPTPYTDLPGTGDLARQEGMLNIEYVLAEGAKVVVINGDRDYRIPWTSTENAVKSAKWSGQSEFLTAGYTPIKGVGSGRQGLVKQAGALSFSRIFDAGHAVNAYAPEAVYRVFNRAMFGKDVETGSKIVSDTYKTTGPTDSWGWRNTMPKSTPGTCMVQGKWSKANPFKALLGVDMTAQ